MVNRVLLRKLARDLWARKGSLLALIAIAAVGVGCLAGIGSVYLDLDGSRRAYYADRRLADFTVACKRAPLWSVDRVAALPNVRDARGRVAMEARIDLPNRDEPITGTAISMPRRRVPVLNDVLLRSGAWFSGDEDEEAIVNDAFARENGLRPGSRIRVTLPDQAHNLLVVGTAMSPEFVFLIPPGVVGLAPDPARFGVIYLPERFLQKACGLDGACNQIVGRVFDASPAALRNTLDQIAGELDPYGVAQVTPSAEQASVRFLADELTGLKTTARTMPVIFLGVAALALNILIARMVAQQRVVIGTFRALGYSRGALTRHFLGYGVAIGAAGGIAGAGVGAWFQRLMVGVYRQFFSLPSIEAHFHPQWLLAGIAVSVAFALLGTVRGVRYAAGLQPAEAMRPPAPQRGGHIVLERIGPLWRRLSFHWKMILRAVFRNPFRSGVSLLAAVISTALILAALSGVDSLNYLINYEFRRVAHQDVTVSLRDPRGRRVLSEVGAMPTVSFAEPQLGVACDLVNGASRKRVGVIGLAPGNRLFTPLDDEGRPIVIPTEGLALSKKLAEILRLQPGDPVRLRPLIGRREEAEAVVAAVVDTYLGLSAYADLRYLSRLVGESWAANVILADEFPGAPPAPLLTAVKQSPDVVGFGRRTTMLAQMDETFAKTMGASIGVMVLFAGLIAFGAVLNTSLVALSERNREVGALRCLGYTPLQVFFVFCGESCLLNGVGILLGLEAGVGLAHLLSLAYDTELYRFPAIILPARIGQSVLLMAGFLAIVQWIVYRMIQRFEWLEALKTKE